jgi:hypothetical protein
MGTTASTSRSAITWKARAEAAEARIATLTETLNERGRYGMPFMWQCKDYADGWIDFSNEHEALNYSYKTGCLVRVVYRAALIGR